MSITLTFAFALVLHLQIGMSFTLRFQECTFITVRFSIGATHRSLPGDVGTVRGTDAAWLTPPVHLTLLPGSAVHVLTRL